MSDNDAATVIHVLKADNERLKREAMEYYRVERVLIAGGIVTAEKVEQAHEIVRGLP